MIGLGLGHLQQYVKHDRPAKITKCKYTVSTTKYTASTHQRVNIKMHGLKVDIVKCTAVLVVFPWDAAATWETCKHSKIHGKYNKIHGISTSTTTIVTCTIVTARQPYENAPHHQHDNNMCKNDTKQTHTHKRT